MPPLTRAVILVGLLAVDGPTTKLPVPKIKVGDVVLFDKPVNEPLLMRVNDREKYRVYPGVNKDRVAVQIASVVEDEE